MQVPIGVSDFRKLREAQLAYVDNENPVEIAARLRYARRTSDERRR